MSVRRTLPVVRWLQVGTVAAGLGVALAAAPAVAWADDDPASASDSVRQSPARSSEAGTTSRSTLRNSTGNAAGSADSANGDATPRRVNAGPARVSAQSNVSRGSDTIDLTAVRVPSPSAATKVAAASATTQSPAASTAVQSPAVSTVAQPKASATATATGSSAPGIGYVASRFRLNLEDVFSGTGKPTVTNPTAVVTGMFHEILRREPTAAELQDYVNRLKRSGVNGVVAGLYNSQAFRQTAVNNYYLELLEKEPTQQQLNRGVFRLTFGTEPDFAAFLAGSQAFYTGSASGGGQFGTQPSAATYVSLLYRTLLGKSTPPNSTDPLVAEIEAGLPIGRAADQFVNTDAYRTVKVGEVYKVLGQAVDQTVIDAYVQNWLRSGGQAGISQSLLATATNVQRIEAGLVTLPDMAAAAVLQTLLLAPYIDGPTGFHAQYKALIGDCSDTSAAACKNPTAYALVKNGGTERGIPNGAISTFGLPATIATMIPTQNEINLGSSLSFPLTSNLTLTSYFVGGIINHPNGPVITANDGTYIVDGHHRWSAIYLINPNAQIIAVDLGYVPTPQTALRESQFGIAATTGTLKTSAAGAPNVYDVTRPVFDLFVSDTIAAGDDPAAVIATFGKYISAPATWDTYTDAKKMEEIQGYMWNNVLRMRDSNPFVPNAPSRIVMPQFDPTTLPTLQNLDGGRVSYSFPTISYLG